MNNESRPIIGEFKSDEEYKRYLKTATCKPIIGVIGEGRRVETTLAKLISAGTASSIDIKV